MHIDTDHMLEFLSMEVRLDALTTSQQETEAMGIRVTTSARIARRWRTRRA
jgi:putative aminopeptidase FrvX